MTTHCPPLPTPEEALQIEPDWWVDFDWVQNVKTKPHLPIVWQYVLGWAAMRTQRGDLVNEMTAPGYYGSVARALKGYLVRRPLHAENPAEFADIGRLAIRAATIAAGKVAQSSGRPLHDPQERVSEIPGT